MAHRSAITSLCINVGWFNQLWAYIYEVTWLAGGGSIREVKITKTPNAPVAAPIRIAPFPFPVPILNDPRIDLPAPTGWQLFPNVAGGTQFEFNLPFPVAPPAPGPPLGSFIPPLAPPAPFVPAPPPAAGTFLVYSVENPVEQQAFTTDHLLGRWPAAPATIPVCGPNHKREISEITSLCKRERRGYRYTYGLRSRVGRVNQGTLFLPPDVRTSSIECSKRTWSTFRVGFDKVGGGRRGEGNPRAEERGILFFGSFKDKIGPKDSPVWISFVSQARPGYIIALANNFSGFVLGPVGSRVE